MKFHMHDASQRKTSESFERIKEYIFSDIMREFDNSKYVSASIENRVIKFFSESTLQESTVPRENRQLEKKWEKQYDRYLDNVKEFEDLWINLYALIWEKYCSREVQCGLN